MKLLSKKGKYAWLAMAVTASLLGGYSATAAEHSHAIIESGRSGEADQTYWMENGVSPDEGIYNFKEDTVLKPALSSSQAGYSYTPFLSGVFNDSDDVHHTVVNMNGHRLDVEMNQDKRFSRLAGKVVGIGALSGDLTIKNVNGMKISATGASLSDDYDAYGIYVTGTTGQTKGVATLTIENNDGWDNAIKIDASDFGNANFQNGVLVDKNSGSANLKITGMVDIDTGSKTALRIKGAYNANQGDAATTVSLGGGRLKSSNTAVSIDGGTLSINARVDKDGFTENDMARDVEITGNIDLKNNYTTYQGTSYKTDGIVALALNTDSSYLNGSVLKNDGTVYLALKNGATWNQGTSGSGVTQFIGGEGSNSSGYIFQKSNSGALSFDSYSGFTTVFYEHANGGTETADYTGGNVTIATAQNGSNIALVTDNTDIDTNDVATVGKVLNALAGKLYYTGVKNGENALGATASIAAGLTSSAKILKTSDVNFDEETGQGTTASKGNQTVTDFNNTLTGGDDSSYTDGGVIAEDGSYHFEKETTITASGNGINAAKDLNIKADKTLTVTATGNAVNGINVSDAKASKVNINAGKLVIKAEAANGNANGLAAGTYTSRKDVNISGAVDITASNAKGSYSTFGINATNADITVNGNVKADINGGADAYGYASVGAIGAQGSSYRKYASAVTVNGDVDISAHGNGLYATSYGSTVTVNGGGQIVIDKTNKNGYSALRADNGTINMNVAVPSSQVANFSLSAAPQSGTVSGGLGNDVVLKGNVAATNGKSEAVASIINLALDTDKSSLEGVAYLTTANNSQINLWLQNGATWSNEVYGSTEQTWDGKEVFTGSQVTTFVGGISEANAGNIFQKDSNALTFDNYSGYTNIYYAHEGNGEDAANYTAGDTIIKSAAEGASVSLITDSENISMSNKDSVAKVLNALAGKLTYEGAKTGENHLTGFVKIAAGLTSSSATLKTGNIGFDENGKGTYVKPDTSKFAVPMTGITATDSAYADADILQDDGYHFTQDTYFNTSEKQSEGRVINARKDMTILANDQTLTFESTTKTTNKLLVNNDKNVTLTAKKLVLQAGSDTAKDASGIYATGKSGSDTAKVTIHGDVDVKANTNNGEGNSFGVYASGNTEVTIDGTYTAKSDEGWAIDSHDKGFGFYHSAGLYATTPMQDGNRVGATIGVNQVDMKLNGTGAFVNGDGATIDMGGGTIEVNKDNTKGYAALLAECGTINMNVTKDGAGKVNGAGTQDVKIKGNVDVNTGAIHDNDVEPNTTINLGLSTKDSSLQGVIRNGFSENGNKNTDYAGTKVFYGFTNLWLQNGAQWTNELYGKMGENYYAAGGAEYREVFEGSHLTNLYGGTSENQAGHIFQKDTATHFAGLNDEDDSEIQAANTLTIDHYSGYTNIYYVHEGNGEATENYKAGDTIIKSAAKDASVSLITDNTGITMDSVSSVTKVLNALAGKLLYSGYANGEKNLTGYVKIADGLTSSSAARKTGDITFAADGRGTYVKPAHDTQTTTEFTTTLTGNTDKDGEYEEGGVIDKDGGYWFTKGSSITTSGNAIDATKDLTIKADKTLTVTATGNAVSGINISNANASKVDINAGKLVINAASTTNNVAGINAGSYQTTKKLVNITGDVDVTASNVNGNSNVFGISAGNADVTITGDVTAKVDGGIGYWDAYSGVAAVVASGRNLRNSQYASTVTINGDVNIEANGTGILAQSYGSTVTVNGGGTITVDKSKNGSIGYSSLRADSGTVNMNVSLQDGKPTGGLGKDVVLKGNIAATNGKSENAVASVINLALDTEKSSLDGVAYLTTANNSQINLWLQNGATWTNEVYGSTEKVGWGSTATNIFTGSNVTNFVGGTSEAKAGNLFQKDSNALTIDNYSGYTNIYYAHEGNGESAENYKAGDTIIKKAAAGSSVSLITDNTNISLDNKDSVAKVLSALAGKLTYSAYANNERNLTGYVKIASGLTGSSQSLRTEEITFDKNTGKGTFVKAEFSSQIQGTADRDTEYVAAGVTTGDQKYTFEKNSSITVGNKDAILGVAEIDADWVTTYEKSYKGITVDAGEHTLTLNTNQRGIYANGNSKGTTTDITAGKLVITSKEADAYRDAAFAVATGGATLNINADVEGTVYGTNNNSYGLYAEKGSTITVNGNVKATKEDGYGIDGKKGIYGIRANDGTITVNGGVNMTVNGTAVAADKGTVNINMKDDKNGATDHDVILVGNVTASNGTVNLGLHTTASKLTGTISGNTNLWLANGATWDNNGTSTVAKLVGGSDASTAGHILANGGMTIDNYSGYTNIYYAHEGNGEAAENYTAGDTTIKSATEGSVVSLITDNTGVDMDNEYSVAKVLNALAGKLTYGNFVNGEKNLTGYVKIADGLTASSIVKKTGDITFDKSGKGTYVPDHQVVTSFKTTLTGDRDTDQEYLMGGVIADDGTYKFTEESGIIALNAIDAAKDLTIKADKTLTVTADKGIALNVTNAAAKTVNITADKLVLKTTSSNGALNAGTYTDKATVNIKGDVDVTATNNNSVYGIYAANADITIDGNVKADVDGGLGGYNYATVAAISSQGSGYRKYASTVKVNGDVDITANGNGLKANGNGSTLTVEGGQITINDPNNKGYSAIRADNGTVNMNVAIADGKATGGLGKDVILKGNLAATNGAGDSAASIVNVALDTAKSSLEGVVYTAGNNSAINLWLQNGATWTNEVHGSTEKSWTGDAVFNGSQVANFVGGTSEAKAGSIFQKDSNALTIDNYSGYTNIYYAHEGNGEAAENYKAGDTIIKSAAEGSVVSLITDSTDVDMTNHYSVANVLNALASKLTYSNFVTGETNLTGYVKIADGLTASSVTKHTGTIAFDSETGKGSLKDGEFTPDVTYPDKQKTSQYTQTITGVEKADYAYKQDGVLKNDGSYVFTTNPTEIKVSEGAAIDAKDKVNITNNEAKLVLEGKEAGIRTNGNTVTISGTTDIKGETGIQAVGGQVTLNGTTTITANGGAAISATQGGEVSIAPENSGVTITGDMIADGSGSKITIDPGKTTGTIKGDVKASDNGSITINLEESHSTLTGSFQVDNASLVMNIKNGATWKLTDDSTDVATQAVDGIATMSLFAAPQAATSPTGLSVNGGGDKDSAGILDMTDRTQDMTIDHYSGWETIIMNRDTNGYTSGNVTIQQANEGSGIALYTNNDGIKMTDKVAVTDALKALAKKVIYADGQDATNGKNLTGFAAIGSGLTASDAKTGQIDFTKLEGQLLENTIQWEPTIEVGDYETFIMKGVRSAATTSFHAWRDNMQDTYTGADLADEDGIFAKTYGGKTSSDVKQVKDNNSYWGAQVGYDKALNNGWHTGVAFDYRDGDSNYLLGGKGDNKLYSFGVYGVKKMADQSYFRIAAKAGRVENEYDVYNELRSNKLHGDYKASAYGLTAEYGKTFGDEMNNYLTPKVQLTWTRVGSKDYTATASNGAKMSVFQDSYDSLVGRLGFEAGMKKAKGSYHAGLYLAHEFNGDINTSYSAKDGGDKSTSFDGEDTWAELVLGGDYSVGKNTQLYADFTRDFSGDFQKKWKLNAGIRLRF